MHLKRDVIHLASILDQAGKVQSYISAYFNKPIIRRFVTKNNVKHTEITKYIHKTTQDIIDPEQYKRLDPKAQENYDQEINYIKITAATLDGVNSEHTSFQVQDEFDLFDSVQVIEEAKMMPGIDKYGHFPITLITSSRKFSYSHVQKMIDKAEKTNTKVFHWNILEVTRKMPYFKT